MERARALGRVLRWGALGITAAALAATAALAVAVLGWRYDVARLRPRESTSLSVIDRRGVVLRSLPIAGGGRASWVPLSEVPATLIAATLAGEDRRFYAHAGVDPLALLRALYLDLRGARLRYGGSTLTMQLVRLLEGPSPRRRTVWNKLRDTVLALRLERAVDKRTILEQYLNRAYYGNGAFGVEAAARHYFARPAQALSEAEATLLAVLPRAPRGYDPRRNLQAALLRRRHVLGLLLSQGRISAAQRERIEATPIALSAPADRPFHAPHFVDHVLAELQRGGDDLLRAGGVVQTTLDLPLQERVEHAVRAHLSEMAPHHLRQAGVVVMDSASGAVRAMVGSADYFDARRNGQINITTTPRHPGSSLKPFVYGLALEQGDTPASIAMDVLDVPSAYKTRNADGRQHGPVRYRVALGSSYNLAAVHVAERVGIGRLLGRLRDAGFTTLDQPADHYGPALALGAGPVRLLDLAAAYTAFVHAEDGAAARPRVIDRIDGRALPREPRRPVFSREVSWLVMDMLADPGARRPAFGDDLPFDLPFPVAGKTGTSGGFSDTVAVAATAEFTVAAWAGNFDGTGTHGVLAMAGAAPLCRAALRAAAGERLLTLPPRPPGIEERPVCAGSGEAPSPACPVHLERFVRGTAPQRRCAQHR
jgi:penicillin-binding protein 1C